MNGFSNKEIFALLAHKEGSPTVMRTLPTMEEFYSKGFHFILEVFDLNRLT